MYKIREKLNSESGMSILMALFLLIVATFVSAIILTASTTGFMAKKSDRKHQQDYLTVSSAVNMFKDYISAASYTKTETKVYEEDGSTLKEELSPTATLNMGNNFKTIMEKALNSIDTFGAYKQTYTISVDDLDNVTVEIEMDPDNYSIYADFYIGEEDNRRCEMFLTIDAKYRIKYTDFTDDDTGEYYIMKETIVSWKTFSVDKGGSGDDE